MSLAQIVVGSQAVFDIYLRDSSGNPVTLSDFVTGKLRFRSCAGVNTEINLTVPGANPDSGRISVVIPSAVTALADEGWGSADLVFTKAGPQTIILPLPDSFEILSPQVPA